MGRRTAYGRVLKESLSLIRRRFGHAPVPVERKSVGRRDRGRLGSFEKGRAGRANAGTAKWADLRLASLRSGHRPEGDHRICHATPPCSRCVKELLIACFGGQANPGGEKNRQPRSFAADYWSMVQILSSYR